MLLVLAVFFVRATINAQVIQGRIIGADSCAVDGATVVLQSVDSTFVEASITDSKGIFTFNRQMESFRLVIQHMLYHTFENVYSHYQLGNIVLQPKDYALKEVVVRGERPLVKVEGGTLAYDIPQLTADKLVTNAYEAIRKVPGIIEQKGILTLAGAGAVHLILNGRPSSMSYEQIVALLKNTPVSRLEQVEVMYTTPPKYHVRGASVNIRLKGYKEGEGGLQGEISADYIQQDEAGGGGGVSLAYTSSKLDADFMYHVRNVYSRQGNDLSTRHLVDGELYEVCQNTDGAGRDTKHMLRLGGTYKFDEGNSLNASYTASLTPDNQSDLLAAGNLFKSQNLYTDKVRMHNAAMSYTSCFGLSIGVDYTFYSNREIQNFSNLNETDNASGFTSRSRQQIDRWKVFADQSHSLSSSWTMNYGVSFSYVSNRNEQVYSRNESGFYDTESPNPDTSNPDIPNLYSHIKEYTYNVYAGFEHRFTKKFKVSVSAALEYYKMMDYEKWAIYPTLQGNYVFSPSHILQFSFNSDKTYPDYWVLSGASSYLNSYQEAVGNAALKPYTSYSGSLAYIFKQKYIFRLSYSHKSDYFTQMVYLDPSRLRTIYNYWNWDYMSQLGFTSVLPFKLGRWWSSQLVLNVMLKHDKASRYYDAPFDNKKWIGVGMWNNTFTLSNKPDIKLELTAFGQTKAIQGSYIIKPLGGIDAAVRYTFPKGNAILQLKADDIFDSRNPHTKVRNGNQWLDMTTRGYERALTLSFSYKFKGYKEKEKQDVDTSRFGF